MTNVFVLTVTRVYSLCFNFFSLNMHKFLNSVPLRFNELGVQ